MARASLATEASAVHTVRNCLMYSELPNNRLMRIKLCHGNCTLRRVQLPLGGVDGSWVEGGAGSWVGGEGGSWVGVKMGLGLWGCEGDWSFMAGEVGVARQIWDMRKNCQHDLFLFSGPRRWHCLCLPSLLYEHANLQFFIPASAGTIAHCHH